MINLEDHKVYVDALKMDMVPLSVAIRALKEVMDLTRDYEREVEEALSKLEDTVNNLNL